MGTPVLIFNEGLTNLDTAPVFYYETHFCHVCHVARLRSFRYIASRTFGGICFGAPSSHPALFPC